MAADLILQALLEANLMAAIAVVLVLFLRPHVR